MSENWNLLQYQARSEPVGDPSGWIEPVFFDGWTQPTQEPVLPVEYRHVLQDFFFVEQSIITPEPPEAVPDYGYYRPADEPVLPLEYRYTLQSVFAPDFEEIISTDSGVNFEAWVQPIQQPVLPIEYRYSIPSLFVQIEPDDFVEGASPPTAQPVTAVVASSRANNTVSVRKSLNSAVTVNSKNSVVTE